MVHFSKFFLYSSHVLAASVPHPLREWLNVLSKWICEIDHGIIVELMDREIG